MLKMARSRCLEQSCWHPDIFFPTILYPAPENMYDPVVMRKLATQSISTYSVGAYKQKVEAWVDESHNTRLHFSQV